jgi:RNA polymerase sigma-70 factor (ECF subfamily)
MWLPSNRPLLDAFRQGDGRALNRVYAHYAPVLAQLLRRGFTFHSGDQAHRFQGFRSSFDLENALQEVFLRAFADSARLRYDGLRPYQAYLATIARNHVIDELRRRGVALEVLTGEAIEVIGTEEPHNQELDALVARFLGTVTDAERELYKLRFVQGLSQADTAAALNRSRVQVRRVEARFLRQFFEFARQSGFLSEKEERSAFRRISHLLALLVWSLP